MVVSGFMEMLNMAALYPVINYGLNLESNNYILNIFNSIIAPFAPENVFLSSCIALLVVTVLAIASKYLYYHVSNKMMVDIAGGTQKRVLNKYISADYDFFINSKQGKLIHTGTIAPDYVTNSVLYSMRTVHDILSGVFLFSLLMSLTWQGTLALVLISLVYGCFVKRVMANIIAKCAQVVTREDRKRNVILNELISGIKSIKIFRSFDGWRKAYYDAVDESMGNRYRMLMGRVLPESFIRFMYFGILATIGIFLSMKSPDALMASLPLFATFALVASRFFPAVQLVGNDLMVLTNAMPNTRIVHELCNAKLDMIKSGDRTLRDFSEAIEFNGVSFKHEGMMDPILKNVTFGIRKGQMVAIVGSSGAGKTTIVNLLLKLFRPTDGSITIDGIDIGAYSYDSYLASVGYVSQETFIYNDTVKKNIIFGMNGCTDKDVEEAARLAHAHEFISEMENRYDTVVGDSGVKLSGGQRQRIAIARAMLRRPEILILDEATSSLDSVSERYVQDAITQISKKTTVVVIAHRLSTIQGADKIVVIDGGSIRGEGTHSDLLDNNSVYFNLYTNSGGIDQNLLGE